MTLRQSLAAPLLISAFLLAACGGGTSTADPPVSPPPTSPSPTHPPHRESPEHFIRRWAAEDVRIQHDGETSRFRHMSRGCAACLKLAKLVERIYHNGGYIHTKGWRVLGISRLGGRVFELHVMVSPTTFADSQEGAERHLAGGHAKFRIEVGRQDNSWHVTTLVQVAS
jgi:hypothetical protein